MPPMKRRQARIRRETKETKIDVELKIDGKGKSSIETGIAFFDHMLTLFAKHGVVDLKLRCKGDLEVDAHHTVEDCGIALGQAFFEALGNKKGIKRYGTGFDPTNPFSGDVVGSASANASATVEPARGASRTEQEARPTGEAYVPMDECLARCVIDFSGRPYLVWRGLDELAHKRISDAEKMQDMSSAFRFGLAREFFQGFANEAHCNLHLELLYGDEPHHIVEALFKAFAKAVDFACQRDSRIAGEVPSTKGKL
jgi:imidazoleglycerol-phosphate dehydratase